MWNDRLHERCAMFEVFKRTETTEAKTSRIYRNAHSTHIVELVIFFWLSTVVVVVGLFIFFPVHTLIGGGAVAVTAARLPLAVCDVMCMYEYNRTTLLLLYSICECLYVYVNICGAMRCDENVSLLLL